MNDQQEEVWANIIEDLKRDLDAMRERAEKAEADHKRMREGQLQAQDRIDAIIIRCKEGAPMIDWIPTIQRLAEEARAMIGEVKSG